MWLKKYNKKRIKSYGDDINLKLCIVLGTRPEIIKMSPIIRLCEQRKLDYFVLHTGQHYSPEMDAWIFKDLELPAPKYNLGVGGKPYGKQVGIMIKEISKVYEIEKPDVVLVQGDTISVLAGALAAKKMGIKVAHHEAGLRSHDTKMLEEINRIIVDHISDYLFCPTPDAIKNVYMEGFEPEQIMLSGNTIVDATIQNSEISENSKIDLPQEYILITAHRAESVDNEENLKNIFKALTRVVQETKVRIIFPIHPRTKKRMQEFKIDGVIENVELIDPVGYLDFLKLEKHAKLIMTDSGGVVEEGFILKVPCVTLRETTERPETLEYGVNVLAGYNPDKIVECVHQMMNKKIQWSAWDSPFGDGQASSRILNKLAKEEYNGKKTTAHHM